jgi:hypothetical protein
MSSSNRENVANEAIEFHDSTVGAIQIEPDSVTIRLEPAIVHRSTGPPGESPSSCWAQEAELYLPGGVIQGTAPPLPCELWDGSIALDGKPFDGLLPAPWETSRSVCVVLDFIDGTALRIESLGMRTSLRSDAKYLDDFNP